MSLLAALTCSVHVVMLTVSHQAAAAELPLLLSFRWPSVPYAIDILAWDLFFGLSMLFAAPAFHGDRLRTRIRVLLTISGTLALVGLIGLVPGAIQLRMIGVVGYVIVYPAALATGDDRSLEVVFDERHTDLVRMLVKCGSRLPS